MEQDVEDEPVVLAVGRRSRRLSRIRRTLAPWVRRYAPCEILGTVGAFGCLWLAWTITGSLGAAAWAGTAGGSIGFYALPAVRAFRLFRGPAGSPGSTRNTLLVLGFTARSLLAEFGPAELVDTALVRPSLLYLLPQWVGSPWLGWLLGELIADTVFYLVAVASFRRGRRLIVGVPAAA